MPSDSSSIDIFGLLSKDSSIKTEDEEKKKRRQELQSLQASKNFSKKENQHKQILVGRAMQTMH